MQITPLKFGGIWILHLKVLEFGFYLLFRFYFPKFVSAWILHTKFSEFGELKSKYSQTLEGKIQILKCQGAKSKHPKL